MNGAYRKLKDVKTKEVGAETRQLKLLKSAGMIEHFKKQLILFKHFKMQLILFKVYQINLLMHSFVNA